jgi:hypothetical protein
MDSVSILYITVGLLIIASRGPLVFAPRATLRFAERLFARNARIRGMGLAIGGLALALVVLPAGDGPAVGILYCAGWLIGGGALWLLVAPASYRRLALGVLSFAENSVDAGALRILGLVACLLGGAMIYAGIHLV